MAKIYEIVNWKRKPPKDTAGQTEKAKQLLLKPPPKKAEVFTLDQIRRLMGDTGPRQFLKDRGNRK
ncbi:hypothetical protein [Brevibacillus massiliensis]|uniref:hypothetical protein n=1 Tax=Brevibacillus massiliensis TaxID=1118054 RepID=UPI0002E9A83B|nr:hypothetical protein [Brevibacillus massiliensis]